MKINKYCFKNHETLWNYQVRVLPCIYSCNIWFTPGLSEIFLPHLKIQKCKKGENNSVLERFT